MPFGWVASQAYFKMHTGAITAKRNHFKPGTGIMSGAERFNSCIYVDDCMQIECPLGSRLSACAACCEWCCKQALGEDSINTEKKSLEGHWSQHQTLLGFEVNTELMMIRLPEEKVEQSRSLILSNEINPGNYAIPLKTPQQLRGLCVHWLTCNLFWRCLFQPIDLL